MYFCGYVTEGAPGTKSAVDLLQHFKTSGALGRIPRLSCATNSTDITRDACRFWKRDFVHPGTEAYRDRWPAVIGCA